MMKTGITFFRSRAVLAAGALLTVVLAGGCIIQPPGKPQQEVDNSKVARTKSPRHKHIIHPPGGANDVSKDAPAPRRMKSSAPAPIIHPPGEQ